MKLKTSSPDIVVLVETWLYPNETHFYNIDGYQAIHSCREIRGGGASIYVKDNVPFNTINSSAPNEPYNWVCLELDNKLKLSAIYRPPCYPGNEFLNKFESVIQNIG